MEPQSWKDLLAKKTAMSSEEDPMGHKWVVTGSSGGKKSFVRRIDGDGFQSAQVNATPRVIIYKCERCNIRASKTVGESGEIIPYEKANRTLTCDEILVKDIIV